LPVLPKWFSGSADHDRYIDFFHDLHCRSGFGDRLVELWAAMTVARILTPGCSLEVYWDEGGNKYPGFTGAYSTALFSIAGCTFSQQIPRGAVRMRKKRFSESERAKNCIRLLRSGGRQIILRSGANWGNSCPDRLHADQDFYGFDEELPIDRIVDTYHAIAHDTQPAKIVGDAIPADIGTRVGIHIRITDKLVAEETPIEMSADSWHLIEKAGYAQIDHCVDRGEPIFLCSDSSNYAAQIIDYINKRGGDVVTARLDPAHANQPGYDSIVDFFALSRTQRIIQMTKYSTFSIAAAICGDVPLVNLDRRDSAVGNRIDIWKSVLRSTR
jgi:hypothetical protein